MSEPVDLSNLRSMTDGDKEMEQMLFQEFCSSAEQCLEEMLTHCTDGANEDWRKAAHALKGAAYNLGAQELGDACKRAQEEQAAPLAEKERMLEDMRTKYRTVKEYLDTLC